MININKYTPQIGSSYIDLPSEIKRKQACINVKNSDDACFAWAIVSALYPVAHGRHPERTSSYPDYRHVLNLDGIEMPITRAAITKFEKLNNISVNTYYLRLKNNHYFCEPSRLTKKKEERHVNLLLIQNIYFDEADKEEENNDDDAIINIKSHYVWIKNLSALLRHKTKNRTKLHVCDRCLHFFYTEIKLRAHEVECNTKNEGKISFSPEMKIKFKNFKNEMKVPFTIYADFECILEPLKSVTTSATYKYQKHVAHSVGYYINCCFDDRLSGYKARRGKDCIKWFRDELVMWGETIEEMLMDKKPMKPLTHAQQTNFYTATICSICKKRLTSSEIRVADHCHLTGKLYIYENQIFFD